MISSPLFLQNFNNATPFDNILSNTLSNNNNSLNNKTNELEHLKQSPFSYTPITSHSSEGVNLNVSDKISFSHSFSLNLDSTNHYTNSYSINSFTGYTPELFYNITDITAIPEYFPVETSWGGSNIELAYNQYLSILQGFDVPWDYAEFVGADIYLETVGSGSLGSVELELWLIEDEGVFPDMNNPNNLSFDFSAPYTNANPVPSAATNNFTFYDFNDTIIPKGDYFIVANLSVVDITDPSQRFAWNYKTGVPYNGKSYLWDQSATWLNRTNNYDFPLIPKLLPLDINKNPKTFTNPASANLTDNGNPITTVNQLILGTGAHDLSTNLSISISFNNSYSYLRTYNGLSSFHACNSTFLDYSIYWNISWSVDQIDFSPYSNPEREHILLSPSDWNTSFYTILVNNTTPTDITRISAGYLIDLDLLIQNKNYFAADLKLDTTSPNYLYSTCNTNGTLETNSYRLGYWTPINITHSLGVEGSSINCEVCIKDISLLDISMGELNLSIYNPEGNINPLKINGFDNLTYIDTSFYSIVESDQISPGIYQVSTAFDPSVYGSDQPGYWTLTYFWNNGTEVGFFSRRISVNIYTSALFEWQVTPDTDIWTFDNSEKIKRIFGDTLNVRVRCYSKTEPFFSGEGVYISSANVTYQTSMLEEGELTFLEPFYSSSIPLLYEPGEYYVMLYASGLFHDSSSIQIPVTVYHQFSIETSKTDYYLNFSNSVGIKFQLNDISNLSKIITPDDIVISINSTIVNSNYYSNSSINDQIEILLDTSFLGLEIGIYEFGIMVSKKFFLEDYNHENETVSVYLHIEEISSVVNNVNFNNTIYHNNQTIISFSYYDTNHSEFISDASVSVYADINEYEVISIYSNNEAYYVLLRIYEPSVNSLNVFLNVSKAGYCSILNLHLATLNIKPNEIISPTSPPNPASLIALIIVVSMIIIISVSIIIFIQVKRKKKKRLVKTQIELERARNIFQSVILTKKILIVHHQTSLPVFYLDLEAKSELDSALVSGILEAISSIGTEISGSPSGIKKIEYYDFEVSRAYSGAFAIYLFSDNLVCNEIFDGLSNIINWFDITFSHQSVGWDGSMNIFTEFQELIEEKISEEIYLWLLYSIELSSEGLDFSRKLSKIDKEIIGFLTTNGKTSVAVILDRLEKYEKEEILVALFILFEEGRIVGEESL